jgi:hypothetical protein
MNKTDIITKADKRGLRIVDEMSAVNPVILIYKDEACIYGSSRIEFIESFLDSYDPTHDYSVKRKIRPRRY